MQTIRQAELHLLDVTTERSVYQGALERAKLSVVPYFSPPPPACKRPPNETPISAHYSFDMVQQVFYPNDPLQPGPMYFLTPRTRKCAFLEYAARPLPNKSITSLMKLSTWGRAPTPSSACSTTSLHTTGWVRREYTCTPTTVVGRIRTPPWCNICCGG